MPQGGLNVAHFKATSGPCYRIAVFPLQICNYQPGMWLQTNVSHEKNPALLSIESWLVNMDPYNGFL